MLSHYSLILYLLVKRISLISLIIVDDSCSGLTYVSSWHSYPNKLFDQTFKFLHIVLRALHFSVAADAYLSRITPNGRGDTLVIHDVASCRTTINEM